MRTIRIFAIIVFGLTTFMSCSKDDDCIDTILNITSLENEYGCVNTKYQMDIGLSENFVIIRDQSTFDTLVSGNCQPTIDFAAYDLVVGKKGLTSGNVSIDYELTEICEMEDLELKATFNQNETAEAPNLTYHALIPKLGDEQTVNVVIEIVY